MGHMGLMGDWQATAMFRVLLNTNNDAFVPKGPNDRSQAIYCLESANTRSVPYGVKVTTVRLALWTESFSISESMPLHDGSPPSSNLSHRTLRDGSLLAQSQAINCLATIS
jgi:hypothetical protein